MEHSTKRLRGVAWQTLAAIALFSLSVAIALQARPRSKKPPKNKAAFSYYLLVLSYAPDFCAQPQGDKDARECGAGRHAGFIVHGLWPQGETTRGPENCGSSSPVSQDIIAATLSYIPTEPLIQHEWKAHGSCSGLTAGDYFTLVRKARDSIKIPDALSQPDHQMQLNPADFASNFASANPGFRSETFRISCYPSKELQEMRICLNKDLSPRACGSSAGQCAANSVIMRPVR
jgi:ribonuclease T2